MTTEFGSYDRSWVMDEHGNKTVYDDKSFSALVEEYESLKRLYREGRFKNMDPREYYEGQKRFEQYVDDRMSYHVKQHHTGKTYRSTKTMEQYQDAVEDAKDELRGDKLILKIFFTLGFLGIGLVLGSTFLIIVNVLNGFWPCTLPVVVGAAMTACLIGAFQGLNGVTGDRRAVRAAERSKRDFEASEAARLVAEYEADRTAGDA